MRGYLFVFLLIILLLTFVNNKENFSYKLINLSVSDSKEILTDDQSSEENINCQEITTQNTCDSHNNVCKWVSRGSDSYACISICHSDDLKNNQSLCIANPNCDFDGQNNRCEIKTIQTTQANSNEDICSLLETMDRCNVNSNCLFEDGICKSSWKKVEIILDGSLDEPKPKLDGNKITTFPPVLILTKAAEMASDKPFP